MTTPLDQVDLTELVGREKRDEILDGIRKADEMVGGIDNPQTDKLMKRVEKRSGDEKYTIEIDENVAEEILVTMEAGFGSHDLQSPNDVIHLFIESSKLAMQQSLMTQFLGAVGAGRTGASQGAGRPKEPKILGDPVPYPSE